jgi:chromosome partitioning protein
MLIFVFNQKGGVGKTTTALNLGAGLARGGHEPVTLVDLDPQTHLTAALGYRAESCGWNVTDWLAGRAGQPLAMAERLFLVPGDCNPPGPRITGVPPNGEPGFVIVDGPPVWNDEVAGFMARADWVLTPLEPEFLSMQGISRLLQKMERNRIPWRRLRLLLCRYDGRLGVHREVRAKLRQRFDANLLTVEIRNSVRLAEAPGHGKSIFDHAPHSTGAEDYAALAMLVLDDGERRG